jgi:serine/threonine protein phosphatase PrpC
MGVEINWRTKQGQQTSDNRDYCGVGLRSDAVLFIVLDGSTSGPKSGEFARLIALELIDWFMEAENHVTPDVLTERLRHIHNKLSPRFRSDSASYVIALVNDKKPVLILHAGDCLAGRHEGKNSIFWLNQPHTLINAIDDMSITEIAATPVRNRLTRSFRAREFMLPDISEISMKDEGTLIIATDGFWAELEENKQSRFLAGEDLQMLVGRDDCSVLEIRTLGAGQDSKISDQTTANFYIAKFQ